jgi:ribosomal protein S18 acetylase RimI-like enzyme
MKYTTKELMLNDLHPDLLKSFNRYQKVQRCLRKENGKWVLKDVPYIEQWDENQKKEIVSVDFTNCLISGGNVWCVHNEHDEVIAFASLLSYFFGKEKQYLQLMQIHTSYEYRNKGIGKELFRICAEKARCLGPKKLYISAHSAEETQRFYENIGCIDAQEINRELAEHEPYDRQMEFVL